MGYRMPLTETEARRDTTTAAFDDFAGFALATIRDLHRKLEASERECDYLEARLEEVKLHGAVS